MATESTDGAASSTSSTGPSSRPGPAPLEASSLPTIAATYYTSNAQPMTTPSGAHADFAATPVDLKDTLATPRGDHRGLHPFIQTTESTTDFGCGHHSDIESQSEAVSETTASVSQREQAPGSTHSRAAASGSSSVAPSADALQAQSTYPADVAMASYPSFSGSFVPPISQRDMSLQPSPQRESAITSAGPPVEGEELQKSANSGEVFEQQSRRVQDRQDAIGQFSSQTSSGSVTVSGPEEASHASTSVLESVRDSSRHSGLSVGETSTNLQARPRSSLMRRPSSAHSSHRPSSDRKRTSIGSSSSSFTPLRQSQSFESRLSIQRAASISRPGSFALAPLKVRDFAFPETDPRHVGARDVGHSAAFGAERFHIREVSRETYGNDGGDNGIEAVGWHPGSGPDWSPSASYDEDEEFEGVQGQHKSSDGIGEELDSVGVAAVQGLPAGLYRVLYDFEAEEEHELSVKVGERVNVVGAVEGGWAVGFKENDDKEGLVPEGYLEWILE